MAPAAKVIKTAGVVLIFFGVIALTLGTSNEEIDAYPQYIDLVSNQKSGEFTTSYNSSWTVEVWVMNDCGNIQMEIRNSQNIIVYNDEIYCDQMEYGDIPSFRHEVNETYTFESNSALDIIIHDEDDLGDTLLESLGFISCCFGVIMMTFSGMLGLASDQNKPVGLMPTQMGTTIPIHTNANNQNNIQITQTHFTQPTFDDKTPPSPVTIVDNDVRQQEEVQEFKPTQEKKSNFWDNVD
jgi:hypothetical protein